MIFTVIPTIISALALFISFAGFLHARKQFLFTNFPPLDPNPEVSKLVTKKENRHNPYNEFYRVYGNVINVKIVNYSKDVSAINVVARVFLSRRKTNDIFFI